MDALDRISSFAMLCINSALCAFVLLAHGGALLLVSTGKVPEMAQRVAIAYVSVPAVIIALAFSVLAFIRREKLAITLKVHAAILIGLAVYMLYVGLEVVFNGVPRGAGFSWNQFFSLLCWVTRPCLPSGHSRGQVSAVRHCASLQCWQWGFHC